MGKETIKDKKQSKRALPWVKCFSLIIAIIVAILLAINIVQMIQLNKWKNQFEVIKGNVFVEYNQTNNLTNQQTELSHYYDMLDEKADVAIDKVIAVVSILTTVVTLFGGLVVFKAPNDVEEKLKEIEDKLEKSNANIEKSNTTSIILDAHSKSDKLDQIACLSSYIRRYNGKEKYLGEIYFERGSLYDETNQYSEAETDFMYAKKLGYDEDQCFNALGVLYNNRLLKEESGVERKKLFKQAEYYYEKANKTASDLEYKSTILCNMACLYGDNGDFEKAFSYFDLSIDTYNDNYNAFLNKAITLESIGEEKYDEALEQYTECIKKNPEYTEAHKYRIDLAIKILEKNFNDLTAKKCYREDYEFLSKESRYLDLMEQRYARITQKHRIDDFIKESLARFK